MEVRFNISGVFWFVIENQIRITEHNIDPMNSLRILARTLVIADEVLPITCGVRMLTSGALSSLQAAFSSSIFIIKGFNNLSKFNFNAVQSNPCIAFGYP